MTSVWVLLVAAFIQVPNQTSPDIDLSTQVFTTESACQQTAAIARQAKGKKVLDIKTSCQLKEIKRGPSL